MKKYIKEMIFRILNCFCKRLKDASILMYHSVGNNGSHITVKSEDFQMQMKYLADNKYKVVALKSLITMMKSGEDISGCVAITFDDGYEDNYTQAYPVLKRYRFPATVFVATDFIGKSMETSTGVSIKMMSEQQIRDFASDELIDIMPHGKSHRVMGKLSGAELADEISGSASILFNIVGNPKMKLFAPPKGTYNSTTIDVLKEEGYMGNVGVQEGTTEQNDDVFKLKRNSIDASTTFTQFRGKVSEAIHWYHKMKIWKGF